MIALRVDSKRKPPMVACSRGRRMGLEGDWLAIRSRGRGRAFRRLQKEKQQEAAAKVQ